MVEHSVRDVTAARGWKRVRKFVSGAAAAALVAGTLVFAGIGVQSALAAPDAPTVTATPSQTLILGEDTSVSVSITNESASPTYNLSVTVLLPDTVDLVEPSPFGPFEKFVAGEVLPGSPVVANGETCATAGLEPVNPCFPLQSARCPRANSTSSSPTSLICLSAAHIATA